MSATLEIAPLAEADLAAALALNNTAEPHVPAVDEARFRRLVALAAVALVARHEGAVVGFLLAMLPRQPHDSAYYQWFDTRYDAFVYVDRIVVGEAARGLGVGRRLYEAVAAADLKQPRIFCEVNEVPPNPVSLAFHTAIGFRVVDTVETSPAKKVVMLEKPLA
jgi:predicted GNAT superfamily acetyltransferase